MKKGFKAILLALLALSLAASCALAEDVELKLNAGTLTGTHNVPKNSVTFEVGLFLDKDGKTVAEKADDGSIVSFDLTIDKDGKITLAQQDASKTAVDTVATATAKKALVEVEANAKPALTITYSTGDDAADAASPAMPYSLSEDVKTFTLKTPQTVSGSVTDKKFTFAAGVKVGTDVGSIDLGGREFTFASSDESWTNALSASVTSASLTVSVDITATTQELFKFDTMTLVGSYDVASTTAAFDKASFDVYAAGKKVATVTFTSKDAEESVTVSTDVTVSFDLKKFDVLKVASGDTEIVSKDGVYSLDIAKVAKIVTIKFASGDNGGSFDVKLTINVDTAASKEYVLNLKGTTFKFTGSNGQSASFDAKPSTYSASSALASVDASGSWGTMSFTVSSDVFSDFTISVDFPASASVAAVYYREGTSGSYTDAADDYTAKVLSPYVGYYKMVFSADLVASSDSSASGKSGYFGFTIQVASVDSGSSSTLVEESAASVEPVTRSDGNKEIPAGRKISTKFLSSNGTLTAAIVSAFFNSNNATSVEMATPEEITAALSKLGFTASDLGDAENGYKIVGLTLPDNVTLRDGMKFFVMITTDKDGSGKSALGMGVLSSKQIGLGFLPIVFKLLKNPANTNNYMTFDADEYFVGATNDMGESSSSTSARVVFVTAEGDTFTIAADEKTLLQGQNASGDAQAYTGDDDDDDDEQETSSHGSSSGCDAGFGALALLAVAGALAVRKVRK